MARRKTKSKSADETLSSGVFSFSQIGAESRHKSFWRNGQVSYQNKDTGEKNTIVFEKIDCFMTESIPSEGNLRTQITFKTNWCTLYQTVVTFRLALKAEDGTPIEHHDFPIRVDCGGWYWYELTIDTRNIFGIVSWGEITWPKEVSGPGCR